MKYLKKITAIATIASLLIATSISTNAAAINGATASTAGTWLQTETIVITDAWSFPDGDEIISAVITNLDGTAAWSTTLTAQWNNADSDTSVLVIASDNLMNDASYFIQFTTVSGDFGTTTLRLGTPANDTLTVTAAVNPILVFAMESNSESFWVLSTTATWVTTWIEVWTNAVSGITVTAETVNGWLSSATTWHTINALWNDALYDAEEYEFSTTLWASDADSTATIWWAATTSMNTANQSLEIYSSDKPQNFNLSDYDVDFSVSAAAAESTPAASDYTDVIIFTATANF